MERIGSANANWMGSLPSKLSAMPLKHLAVPGSHDSFTYWVDVHAPVRSIFKGIIWFPDASLCQQICKITI
uniref:Phosphatidylinositol specific phospholipase C X domain containing 2 n=1 Tax=Takifugu rubripes TaxID=31033 RepID=A0A674M9H6_TAKRU